jgi:hypothetical protein
MQTSGADFEKFVSCRIEVGVVEHRDGGKVEPE